MFGKKKSKKGYAAKNLGVFTNSEDADAAVEKLKGELPEDTHVIDARCDCRVPADLVEGFILLIRGINDGEEKIQFKLGKLYGDDAVTFGIDEGNGCYRPIGVLTTNHPVAPKASENLKFPDAFPIHGLMKNTGHKPERIPAEAHAIVGQAFMEWAKIKNGGRYEPMTLADSEKMMDDWVKQVSVIPDDLKRELAPIFSMALTANTEERAKLEIRQGLEAFGERMYENAVANAEESKADAIEAFKERGIDPAKAPEMIEMLKKIQSFPPPTISFPKDNEPPQEIMSVLQFGFGNVKLEGEVIVWPAVLDGHQEAWVFGTKIGSLRLMMGVIADPEMQARLSGRFMSDGG